MIRPLRQLHRRTFIVLGIFLPVAFAVGIAARKTVPENSPLPPALAGASQHFSRILWEQNNYFSNAAIQVRLRQAPEVAGKFAVEFSAPKKFTQPDLLVYWTAGNLANADSLPDHARLLGSFSAAALPLPIEAVTTSGRLILFSLANGEIVDVSKPISLQPLNSPTH